MKTIQTSGGAVTVVERPKDLGAAHGTYIGGNRYGSYIGNKPGPKPQPFWSRVDQRIVPWRGACDETH